MVPIYGNYVIELQSPLLYDISFCILAVLRSRTPFGGSGSRSHHFGDFSYCCTIVICFSYYISTKKNIFWSSKHIIILLNCSLNFKFFCLNKLSRSRTRPFGTVPQHYLQYYVLQVYDPRLCLYFRFYCKYGLAKSGFILGSEFCIHTH